MTENFVFVNTKKIFFEKNLTVIQACLRAGIEIPRFCYHDRLSIAGNCRMCLVEIEKSPKPMASCALPLMPNMKIFTNTVLVKKAREGILEFLLANHPLDCPICDQGGECDLQDQSVLYGSDRGRFYEKKRAVENKDCGPLIKTLMTRCIHCTRCIRFSSEIAGISFLGTTGRGLSMEVGSYLEKVFNSNLSGNVIDLCPVGALTSKNYAFTARPWDLSFVESIDVFDSLNSNISLNFKGLKVLRVLPSLNEKINEEWISDKIRFCLDGLEYQRILSPFIKNSKGLIKISWYFVMNFLKKIFFFSNRNFLKFKGVFGPLLDSETLFSFKKFSSIFHNKEIKNSLDFQKNLIDFRKNYFFSFLDKFQEKNIILFIGVNFSIESPVFKARFNSLLKDNKAYLYSIGCSSLDFSKSIKVQNLGNDLKTFFKILEGNHWVNSLFLKKKKISFILGDIFFSFETNSFLQENINIIVKKLNTKFNLEISLDFFSIYSSILQGYELGLNKNKNSFIFDSNFFNLDYLLQPEFNEFRIKSDFLIFQGHHGSDLSLKSDIILPSCSFIEQDSLFLNVFGFCQKSKGFFKSKGLSKKGWKIFFMFLEVLKKKSFLNLNFFFNLKNLRIALFDFSLLFRKFFFNKKVFSLKKTLILKKSFFKNKMFSSIVTNFYSSGVISKSSPTMLKVLKFNTFLNFK